MLFGLGVGYKGYGGDDATELALGIENRSRLARQGGKQMFIEFRATRLANGFQNSGIGAGATKGGRLQLAHRGYPLRRQVRLEDQPAGAVVQRQNIAERHGADGKTGASCPSHHGRAAFGPDRHAATGADLRGERFHLATGCFDRIDSPERTDADPQRRRSKIVTAACGVLRHQPLPHQALHITMGGGTAGAGAFSQFAKRKRRIRSGEKVEKTRRDRHGLNKRRALFALVFGRFVRVVIHGVQASSPGVSRMTNASGWKSESISAAFSVAFIRNAVIAEQAVLKLCCKYGTSRYGSLFVRNTERILYCETDNASVT
ncbi:hypothetical protein D3C72_1057650 [compost metagenome]